MPKTKISEYSTTNADNTDIESINIAEGCAPSGINNAIRELMVHLKEFQTGASGDGFTFAGGTLMTGTNTLSGTNVLSGSTTAAFAAGTVSAPSIYASGDTNTGIFFPAADTIAFAEGGAEAMRINSSGNVGIGTDSPGSKLDVKGTIRLSGSSSGYVGLAPAAAAGSTTYTLPSADGSSGQVLSTNGSGTLSWATVSGGGGSSITAGDSKVEVTDTGSNGTIVFNTDNAERMRITAAGKIGIGATSPVGMIDVVQQTETGSAGINVFRNSTATYLGIAYNSTRDAFEFDSTYGATGAYKPITFRTSDAERARILSNGVFLVGKTVEDSSTAGCTLANTGTIIAVRSAEAPIVCNRLTDDGTLVSLRQASVEEGNISVSGNTVSYNSFAGSHWSQLQQGRGYNPEIPRGTVMSSIGEMAEWKSVVWDEVIEHPATEDKEAWTQTIQRREAYIGDLLVGATFTEDGVTKTVVDDGNERLPKVKISDVVGDKAVYGVFQTYDEVQDMLVTALGAFVVRIAAGVTVQIGDLLESNGDGCAKVQDDDVIRSKTIGKVTSTVKTATYADGSYTVPCVLYCG